MKFELKPESGAFIHLDILRFVAACGVVFHHYASALATDRFSTEGLTLFVDLFFVISGVIVAHVYGDRLGSWREYGTFMRRRIARLAPLHWAALGFYILVWWAAMATGSALNDPQKYDPACIVPNLTLTHAFGTCSGLTFNQPSWSISAEMGVYLLAPLVMWLSRRSVMASGASVIAIVLVFTAFAGAGWTTWKVDGGVLRALPSFLIGAIFYRCRVGLRRLPAPQVWAVGALTLFLCLQAVAPRLALLALVYFLVAAAVAADARNMAGPILYKAAGLGQLTYSIYMLHLPIWTLVVAIVGQKVLHLTGAALGIWAALAFGIVLAAAPLSLFLFEGPLRRALSGGRWSRREATV